MNKSERGILILAALVLLTTLTFLPRSEAKRSTQERSAQEKGTKAQPIFSQAVRSAVSDEVKNLPATKPFRGTGAYGEERVENEINKRNSRWVYGPIQQKPESPDGALSSPKSRAQAPGLEIPAPITSFDGMSNADNFAAFGFRISPPDTDGDVGPNHYVAQVNLLVRVYTKLGVPLTAPFKLSSLFAPLGGICSTDDDGDPIVLYDPLADRWLLSQFAFNNATFLPPYHMCIAISKTPNPTGAYFLYDFVTGGDEFPDYPKLGVWPDGYYITTRQFTNGGPFNNPGAGVYDRAKMLAGDPTAGQIYFNLGTAGPLLGGFFDGLLPSDFDGLTAPPAGRPNTFAIMTADEFGGGQIDAVRLFDFHADFGTPANSTFTERAESPVVVAAFNPLAPGDFAGNRRDIPQPPPAGPTNYVDSITRLLHRLQYVNYGTFDSLVMNHSVDADATAAFRSGVRYYQFRNASPGVSPFTVAEQATHAPADTEHRWMASAAADNQSNIAVGYSVSSLTVHPSVRYAGRLATDPPGGLFQGENTLVAGSGVQLSTTNRWGDYSAMNVDPSDDCTFWYTQEYYTAASQATSVVGWLTRIGSFKVNPACTTPPRGTLNVTVTDCTSGLPIQGATVTIDGNVYGSTLADGTFSTQLAPGSYSVSVSKPGYSVPATQIATITNGGVTSLTFCMNQVAVPAAAGLTLVNESCPPFNGAADPGERVSVNLSVMNNGAVSSTNLVGTLQATANVLAPDGPKNYGAIPPGGTATRTFSFTANGACGQTITLTLQLQDGANNLGTVTYTMTLGALGAPVTATYSSGNIAVVVPDNTTVEVPITVADSGSVADVNVKIRIDHTWDSDMVISLVHPDGTIVPLANQRGGSGDNFGTGTNNCSGTPTTFDDSAVTAISAGVAPFSGSFKPETPLSALNGKNSLGTWKLRVQDVATGDVGLIGCVQLEITRQPFVCNNSCTQARLVVTQSLSRVGTDVIATLTVQNQGITTATAVTLTLYTLGGNPGTPGPPLVLGNIAAGASASSPPINFGNPGPAGSTRLLKVNGKYDISSTFSKSQNVILP